MFSSLTISRKLLAAFMVNICIAALILFLLWGSLSRNQMATQKSDAAQQTLADATSFEMSAQRMNAQIRGYVITGDVYYVKIYNETSAQMREALAKISTATQDPLDAAAVKKTKENWAIWEDRWGRPLIELVAKGHASEAADIIRTNREAWLIAPFLAPLRERRIELADRIKEYADQQAHTYKSSIGVIAFGGLALIISVIVLCILLTRAIANPIEKLTEAMSVMATGSYASDVEGTDRRDELGAMARAVEVFRENGIAKNAAEEAKRQDDAQRSQVIATISSQLSEVSTGNLTAAIVDEFPTEYITLKTNFNTALANLRDLIGAVSESAAAIRTGSGEIAQASEDLARRTESNAASLEETAASVTQMDGRLRASAEAAARTVDRADQAITTVGGGRAVADEAVQAMGRVSESAKGIDSVIEGLDKIAFQTRVLAMNAAVEAGRAGDAGRGFAVVADLVSALAMRAEEEAKRARDQLTVTQTDIVTAVEAVTKVDGALANISGDVVQVHELLATMAADNQVQSAAITQISAAIGTMDHSTQQNAAMVEETSAAARNLASEVGNLADQAGRFRVGQHGGKPAFARKPNFMTPAAYTSPIKPLAPATTSGVIHQTEDWHAL
jgi:methyl-accepting chemotaxis protein